MRLPGETQTFACCSICLQSRYELPRALLMATVRRRRAAALSGAHLDRAVSVGEWGSHFMLFHEKHLAHRAHIAYLADGECK